MTEASVKALADVLSSEIGQRVGIRYQRIDGSNGSVD
jgi:hypothetical protein